MAQAVAKEKPKLKVVKDAKTPTPNIEDMLSELKPDQIVELIKSGEISEKDIQKLVLDKVISQEDADVIMQLAASDEEGGEAELSPEELAAQEELAKKGIAPEEMQQDPSVPTDQAVPAGQTMDASAQAVDPATVAGAPDVGAGELPAGNTAGQMPQETDVGGGAGQDPNNPMTGVGDVEPEIADPNSANLDLLDADPKNPPIHIPSVVGNDDFDITGHSIDGFPFPKVGAGDLYTGFKQAGGTPFSGKVPKPEWWEQSRNSIRESTIHRTNINLIKRKRREKRLSNL
jgi:hypothetical protein